jgi:uncharacterized protein YfdQ (DUF2303 family)
MSIKSELRALANANGVQLTQDNLAEFLNDNAQPLNAFVKNDVVYVAHILELAAWLWKDNTETTKDRGAIGDYVVLGNDGSIKLMTPTQFENRDYVLLSVPTCVDNYVFPAKPVPFNPLP